MKDQNTIIELYLSGLIDADEFINQIRFNAELKEYLRCFIQEEKLHNSHNIIWSHFSYDALAKCNFDLYKHIKDICRLDGTIGDNLNLFSIVKYFYSFFFPQIICTTRYEECFSLYLLSVQDCFDGPEVRKMVYHIINDVYTTVKNPKERIIEAKKRIHEAFHFEGKRPYWIQGEEWPMGNRTPMTFMKSNKIKGGKIYFFEDKETGENKKIVQYY